MADDSSWTHEEIMDFISAAKEIKFVTESDHNMRNVNLFRSVQQAIVDQSVCHT